MKINMQLTVVLFWPLFFAVCLVTSLPLSKVDRDSTSRPSGVVSLNDSPSFGKMIKFKQTGRKLYLEFQLNRLEGCRRLDGPLPVVLSDFNYWGWWLGGCPQQPVDRQLLQKPVVVLSRDSFVFSFQGLHAVYLWTARLGVSSDVTRPKYLKWLQHK